MTITAGVSTTQFDVSSADAAKYEDGWVIDVFKPNMLDATAETNKTISSHSHLNGTVRITISPAMSGTPAAGDIVQFAAYDNLTADQKLYWALSDGSDYLGTANDDAHLLVA